MIEHLRTVIKNYIYNEFKDIITPSNLPKYYVDEIIARFFVLSFGMKTENEAMFSTVNAYYDEHNKNNVIYKKDEYENELRRMRYFEEKMHSGHENLRKLYAKYAGVYIPSATEMKNIQTGRKYDILNLDLFYSNSGALDKEPFYLFKHLISKIIKLQILPVLTQQKCI